MKASNVFVSHHHKDDDAVDKLADMMRDSNRAMRNSSIRARPENERRVQEGRVPERTLKRLLRMKISWAGAVVVLLGKETHKRPWVEWEIKEAIRQGKRVVGVWAEGVDNAQLPSGLEAYADAVVNWDSVKLIAAIDGELSGFYDTHGEPGPATPPRRYLC